MKYCSKSPKGEFYGEATKIKRYYNKIGDDYAKIGKYCLAHYYWQYAEHYLRTSWYNN